MHAFLCRSAPTLGLQQNNTDRIFALRFLFQSSEIETINFSRLSRWMTDKSPGSAVHLKSLSHQYTATLRCHLHCETTTINVYTPQKDTEVAVPFLHFYFCLLLFYWPNFKCLYLLVQHWIILCYPFIWFCVSVSLSACVVFNPETLQQMGINFLKLNQTHSSLSSR